MKLLRLALVAANAYTTGIAFDRSNWPHGATGNAVPHGTVFGW